MRFTLWTDPLAPALADVLPSKCCNAQTAARAAYVARQLDIPYHILDLSEAFKADVVDPYLEAHLSGETPNPCIRCNRTMKFGRLLDLMKQEGCERLATGHYARTAIETLPSGQEQILLLQAIDPGKDQSYYLYGLTQAQLAVSLFPLGSLTKHHVRALAEEFQIPYEADTYRESQDLCFFPEKTPQAFLQRHLAAALSPGPIVRRHDGVVLGQHRGLPLYTVGQRRGLGVGGLRLPLEVVAKEPASGTLWVEERGCTTVDAVTLREVHWVTTAPDLTQSFPCEARVRSLSTRLPGTVKQVGSSTIFVLQSPQPPQAAGQHLVLYRGDEVLGGGVMC